MKTQTKPVTILITGGHIMPALALVDVIRTQYSDWSVACIGRRNAFEGDRSISEEYRLVTGRGIPFYAVTTGRFARYGSVTSILSLVKVPIGFLQSLLFLRRITPTVIVSFGGYVALPVVLAARIMGIPVVTHEQTRHASLSNRIIGWCARTVYTSYKETVRDFPEGKAVYTGLPLRRGLFHPPPMPSFPIKTDLPLLYVTGGVTGARSLNAIVFGSIPTLIRSYRVVHQTGRYSFDIAKVVRERLPKGVRERYVVVPFLDETDVAWVYQNARIVIGRSGANTVGEIAAFAKVALFIPLPWSAEDEQKRNASALSHAGSSVVVDQKTLTPETLTRLIQRVERQYQTLNAHAIRLAHSMKKDAAEDMVKRISSFIAGR